jgi:NAD(P)-dependent dehydrogenase (short-subunit alcohol dehydrogenase family)
MKKYEKWIETNTHLLTNQLAVVVGGTGSIGKEVVDILLHLKAKVIIAARNIVKAEALKKQMLLKYPNAYIYVEYLDISNLQSIDDFQLAIDAKYQKIDIFINNSGIYHQNSSLSKDGYEIHFATNTLGNYYLSKKIIFDLKYHSKMVFVSSLAANYSEIDFSDIESLHVKNKMKIYGNSKSIMTMSSLKLKAFLLKLEVYAYKCFVNEFKHLKAAKALVNFEDIVNYDFTTGYPDKITLE